jgi:hypothetical protein
VGYWLLALPFSLWLAFPKGLGAIGLWWGLVAGLALVGAALAVRVRVRLWGQLERIRVDDPSRQKPPGVPSITGPRPERPAHRPP